jgi:6-phosphogluconolactonase
VFERVEQTGVFEYIDRVSICPSDVEVENYPGEVLVHPDGKRLYASNRGHDSIVVFEIDPEGGSLEPRAWVNTKDEWPRHFSPDPAGETLFVGNQRSGSVTVFRVPSESGQPHRTEASIPVPNPTCVVFTRFEDE